MAPQKESLSKILVIDGHNLIPRVSGLSLADLDDEEKLIELLVAYAVRTERHIEVFFDKAAPTYAGVRKRGPVNAHFVHSRTIADEAIRQFITWMGKQAKNVTVISSDRRVQAEVKALGARTVASEAFAPELNAVQPAAPAPQPVAKKPQPVEGTSAGLDDWLELFGLDPELADKPIKLGGNVKKKKPVMGKSQPPAGQPQPAAGKSQPEAGRSQPAAGPLQLGESKSQSTADKSNPEGRSQTAADKPAADKPAADRPGARKRRFHGFEPKK